MEGKYEVGHLEREMVQTNRRSVEKSWELEEFLNTAKSFMGIGAGATRALGALTKGIP